MTLQIYDFLLDLADYKKTLLITLHSFQSQNLPQTHEKANLHFIPNHHNNLRPKHHQTLQWQGFK